MHETMNRRKVNGLCVLTTSTPSYYAKGERELAGAWMDASLKEICGYAVNNIHFYIRCNV